MGARTICLSVVVASYIFLTSAASFAADPHDGVWLLTLTTKSSQCNPTYLWRVTIKNGRASGRAQGRWGEYLFNGSIEPTGRVAIGYRHIGAQGGGTIDGHVAGDGRATGNWSGSGGDIACVGTFTGRRGR